MGKKRKFKKDINNKAEVWTEEQHEEFLEGVYGLDFIAGFTEGGVPYGTFIEDDDIDNELIVSNISRVYNEDDDDMPF